VADLKSSKIKIERAAIPTFIHLYKLNQTWNDEKAKIGQQAGKRPPGQM
jgi:hypothetical protein